MTEAEAAYEWLTETLSGDASLVLVIGLTVCAFAIPEGESRPAVRFQRLASVDTHVGANRRAVTDFRFLVVGSCTSKEDTDPMQTALTIAGHIDRLLHGVHDTHQGFVIDCKRLEPYDSHQRVNGKDNYEFGGIYRLTVRP